VFPQRARQLHSKGQPIFGAMKERPVHAKVSGELLLRLVERFPQCHQRVYALLYLGFSEEFFHRVRECIGNIQDSNRNFS
jgi:hypothetical protein